ncbi:MAG TPA: peptide-methionine (S)-S-oxide reductase MsrA [Patescibacteria group bacterium]|jgi:peptide methionine sulfoxide reductase msrA/msrB|nr:peptide-methionine (S)-S-oxide reductase MsrA [Patescibacteria group bacterium]
MISDRQQTEKAIFATGCFWGVQYYFDQVPGVVQTIAGYSGGRTVNPSYEEVCSCTTGHAEAVEVEFDPNIVSYETLVKHFFRLHDPTQLNRQGPDIGDNYRSAIFYTTADQRAVAEHVKTQIQNGYEKPIVTEISPLAVFYRAEKYHQKFTQRTGRGICHVAYTAIK